MSRAAIVMFLGFVFCVTAIIICDAENIQKSLLKFYGENTIERNLLEFNIDAEIEDLNYTRILFSKSYCVEIVFLVEENTFNKIISVTEFEYYRLLTLKSIEIEGVVLEKVYEDGNVNYIVQNIRMIYPDLEQ